MDATNPLARGTTLPAEAAAALAGGILPWRPDDGDPRRAPAAGGTSGATDPAPTAESGAEAVPADLVAAFKQALAGPAPTPARPPTDGPATAGSGPFTDQPASRSPRPEALYSQVAAAFAAPAATSGSATPSPVASPSRTDNAPEVPAVSKSARPVAGGATPAPTASAPPVAARLAPAAGPAPTTAATPPTASAPARFTDADALASNHAGTRSDAGQPDDGAANVAGLTAADPGRQFTSPAAASTATPAPVSSGAGAALPTRGNVPSTDFSGAPNSVPAAIQPRTRTVGTGVEPTQTSDTRPSLAALIGRNQGNQSASLAPVPAANPPPGTSEAADTLAAPGDVPLAAVSAVPNPVPAATASQARTRAAGHGVDAPPTGDTSPSLAAPTGSDQGNRFARPAPASPANPPPATSEVAAALAAPGNVPRAAFSAAPTSIRSATASQPRTGDTDTSVESTPTGDTSPSLAAPTGSDEGNRFARPAPASPANPPPATSETADTLAAPGSVPRAAVPAVPNPLPAATASQPRTRAAGDGVDTPPIGDTSPSLAAPTGSDQGNRFARPAPAPTANPPPVSSEAADTLAAPGDVPRAAFSAALTSIRPATASQPRTGATGPRAEFTLSTDTPSSRTTQTGSEHGSRFVNPATGSKASPVPVSSDAPPTLPSPGNIPLTAVPAVPTSFPAATTSQTRTRATGTGVNAPPAGDTPPSLAALTSRDPGHRFASLAPASTGTPPPATSDAPADTANRGNLPGVAFPAAPTSIPAAAASQPPASTGGTRTEATLKNDPPPSLAAQTGNDRGNPFTSPAPTPGGASVFTSPLRVENPAIRTRPGDLPAAAYQPSSELPPGEPGRDRPAAAAPTEESPGDAVLRSLAFQAAGLAVAPSAPSTPVDAPAPARPADRVAALRETIAATVSRVLVSDPLHDGGREVRIEFSADVLPGTSVRLWRHEGRLNVEFTSTVAVAEAGLRDGLPRLAEAIQRQSPQAGLPEISLRLGDAAGQPGDGRSRQRYESEDENGAQA